MRALFDASLAVVRRSSSGTVALARLAGIVDLDAVPARYRKPVARKLDAALAATGDPLPLGKVERELLVELERAAQALETTLAELGDAGRRHGGWLDGSGFAARRGKLPPPVDAGIVAP